MPRIFIDLTEDESHWNGEIGIRIANPDDLGGHNMALAIGDHQIVLSITQAITLFDLLDGWLNAGPVREVGAIRGRVLGAVRELVKDRNGIFKRFFTPTFTEETFVHELEEYIRLQGLRFRLTGDEVMRDDARDRAQAHRLRMGFRDRDALARGEDPNA